MNHLLRRFVDFNRRLSFLAFPKHWKETHAYRRFHFKCIEIMVRPEIRTVLDVGAGKRWHFSAEVKETLIDKLVGVDIEEAEMKNNELLDEKVVADVSREMPLNRASVDMIMVRAGVEHFPDNEAFLRNCSRCLRPGGYLVATFANKYAPFALINQLLPTSWSRLLLRTFVPGAEGVLGFEAFYDRASYTGFSQILIERGFEIEDYHPSFFGSEYFAFFFPLFIVSLTVDVARFLLGIKNLSSYHLFVARKR